MMTEELFTVFQCDHDRCEAMDIDQATGEGEPPIGWFIGTVLVDNGSGTREYVWHACRITHVRGAIESVIQS